MAKARYECLKNNRYLMSFGLDLAISRGEKEEAADLLLSLIAMDPMREKYYRWRMNNL